MEHTWGKVYGDEDPHYEFTLGALREKVPENQRLTYYLVDTEISGSVMRQLYLRRSDRDSSKPDELIELIWRK